MAARRGRELLRASLPAVAGFLLGSLPWWIYNLAHDFLSVRAGYVPGTAARDAGALDHLVYTLAERLPELLASTRSLRIFLGDGVARAAIGAAIVAIYLVLALLALVEWRRGRAAPAERPAGGAGDAAGLAAGIVGLTLLANSLAGGRLRTWRGGGATGIADGSGVDAGLLLELALGAPEAAEHEQRSIEAGLAGRGPTAAAEHEHVRARATGLGRGRSRQRVETGGGAPQLVGRPRLAREP